MPNDRLRDAAPPTVRREAPTPPGRLIGRFYFGTAGLTAACSAGILAATARALDPPATLALVAAITVFAVLCGVAFGLSHRPRFPLGIALVGAALSANLLGGAVDWTFQAGLHSPLIGFAAVSLTVVGAIVGLRGSVPLALLTIAQVAALAVSSAPAPGMQPLPVLLTFQALVVVCGVVAGALVERLFRHYSRAAAEREERFHGLLRIAVDWYWEQDHLFRFTQVSGSHPGADSAWPAGWRRRALWQIPGVRLADAELDAHRADLESHLPFSGLLVQCQDAAGQWRVHSLSGEPQWDAAGVFRGYWGVAREVTRELLGQRALKASEKRYRELFTHSPSAIVLHRHGVVIDANEAAARLFGFASAAEMTNIDSIALWPPGEGRERLLDRLDRLERLPVGGALPVEDSQVRALDGRLLSLQSTGVRVETAGGLANLSIFFDVTARQTAEAALRRSEAMLSHLFATSPDGIALIELASQRFSMVNPAFSRVSGYRADEAVGRTAAELGLWEDPRNADALAEALERDGTVADFTTRFVTRAREPITVRLAAGRFRMAQRDYLVLNARDITDSERTRLEHAAILARASIGIAFTRERRFVQANPFFVEMFGHAARGSLVGEPDTTVWPDGNGGAIGAIAAAALARGEAFEIEREMRRPDGGRFACRLLAQAVDPADAVGSGTIWIAEDVTEQRRLDQALATARDAAEAANLAKSAFLANTNHEIRTPLNGLLGLAQLALDPALGDAKRREYLAQILDSARGLAGVMSDILDVSKIEAGEIALDDLPFVVRDTLAAVQKRHRQAAEAKGVELRLEVDPSLPQTLRGDPQRLRQIVDNFVGNALKFTARGSVTVHAGPTPGGGLRIAVTDTGPGIDTATQARLFTPFWQGDSSTTRRFGGNGLGLVICRELAQLMGGRVGVTSQRGTGSTFWAELPLPSAAAFEPAGPATGGGPGRFAGRRVLVVEDNPVNMMVVVAMLENWGFVVAQAQDGRAAVDAVHEAARRDADYALVLMDVQMPVMSGHEATRQLRRHFSAADLPIIALTAAALVSEREEALRAGMNDFLTKPIDAARLQQALLRHLGG